jgi:hypothetical protein
MQDNEVRLGIATGLEIRDLQTRDHDELIR